MAEEVKIHEELRKAIESQGISIEELARRSKVSSSQIHNVLAGGNTSVKTLDKIGKHLGMRIMIGRETTENTKP